VGPPTSADIGDVTYTVQIPVRYMIALQTGPMRSDAVCSTQSRKEDEQLTIDECVVQVSGIGRQGKESDTYDNLTC
jgi:hypothetical protein